MPALSLKPPSFEIFTKFDLETIYSILVFLPIKLNFYLEGNWNLYFWPCDFSVLTVSPAVLS